ncbi:MAG: T9SS type A sorting domain-containing protein [Bacteroidetes bacterium]|nr:T9SS type A sorting domain-containing protein [Bacteroidota bacterium]
MKNYILIVSFILIANIAFEQYNIDQNNDGVMDITTSFHHYNDDLNGYGIVGNDIIFNILKSFSPTPYNINSLSFSSMWTSPSGAFSNCRDGAVGYFDNDTLLDIAGYTFSPNKFYVWEQTVNTPDSFALVTEIAKAEGSGFGPMIFGDTDGDGKTEIIIADFASITRIYIYENNGDNVYVSQNTQSLLTHGTPDRSPQSLMIGDLNKNGEKEIICTRGNSSEGGMVRIWEHTGAIGSNTYTDIYTYTTSSHLSGKGGIGDSDHDGWDEVFITCDGSPLSNTYIRRIEYDSASASFNQLLYQASSIGKARSYMVKDVNNDSVDELVATLSTGIAAFFVYTSTGPNQYQTIDSVFEPSDSSDMISCDIRLLSGRTYPTILLSSFGGKVYMYEYNGTSFAKQYEKLDYPGDAVRRVYWFFNNGKDGYFNTWSSSSSNGTFYLFKRDGAVYVQGNVSTPSNFILYQNYPNPFNPVTTIEFDIASNTHVDLNIYDVLGRKVKNLVNENLSPGSYKMKWNGSELNSGIYFYKLKTEKYSEVRSMVLVK